MFSCFLYTCAMYCVQIRRKMVEIMANQASTCDLKELVSKFIPEVIGKEIEKSTSSIFPLQNVFIRKVKILKAPKFDLGKLMEVSATCMVNFFSLDNPPVTCHPKTCCLSGSRRLQRGCWCEAWEACWGRWGCAGGCGCRVVYLLLLYLDEAVLLYLDEAGQRLLMMWTY